jgi:hypothetical protein
MRFSIKYFLTGNLTFGHIKLALNYAATKSFQKNVSEKLLGPG